jgi:citrate synthase
MPEHAWMTAAEAASRLRVSRPTLYAYVSRGYIRSQAMPGSSRARGYSRDDVERLRRRTEERRNPDQAAAHALQWGMPILESSITLIDGNRLFYRGHDAVTLATTRPVAEVASLIWTGQFHSVFAAPSTLMPKSERRRSDDLPFLSRAQSVLAAASVHDPMAFDPRAQSAALCGWRIVHLLRRVATGPHSSAPTIDRALGRAWGVGDRGVDLLRAALILCADHELNVSAFTARCVASAGSTPYAVVIAGLAALEGTKHGGASARMEVLLETLRHARDLRTALAERLRRGEPSAGFGHPLYPNGDPRAATLVDLIRDRYPKSAEATFILELAKAAGGLGRERPNLDFALAALARVLQLPPGSPLTLFAIGRSIGWIGHAIEQYTTDQLIRPRAKYTGVVPGAT